MLTEGFIRLLSSIFIVSGGLYRGVARRIRTEDFDHRFLKYRGPYKGVTGSYRGAGYKQRACIEKKLYYKEVSYHRYL